MPQIEAESIHRGRARWARGCLFAIAGRILKANGSACFVLTSAFIGSGHPYGSHPMEVSAYFDKAHRSDRATIYTNPPIG